MEVPELGAEVGRIEPIEDRVGAAEGGGHRHVAVDDRDRFRLARACDLKIAEAVPAEFRPDNCLLPGAEVAVLLDLPLAACREEFEPVPGGVQQLAVPDCYRLPGLSPAAQVDPAGDVFAAVVKPPAAPFPQEDRGDFPDHPVGRAVLPGQLRFGRVDRHRGSPAVQGNAGRAPAGAETAKIVGLAVIEVVFEDLALGPEGGRIAFEEDLLPFFGGQGQLIAEFGEAEDEIPLGLPAGLVVPAVAELDAQHILPLPQIGQQVVGQVVGAVAGALLPDGVDRPAPQDRGVIGDGGDKFLIPHPPAVDIQVEKAEPADLEPGGFEGGYGKATAEKRGLADRVPLDPVDVFHK